MNIPEATIEILKSLLQRPDARLFSPDELATEAYSYADAVEKIVQTKEAERMAAFTAVRAQHFTRAAVIDREMDFERSKVELDLAEKIRRGLVRMVP